MTGLHKNRGYREVKRQLSNRTDNQIQTPKKKRLSRWKDRKEQEQVARLDPEAQKQEMKEAN